MRDECDELEEMASKNKRKYPGDISAAAKDVCDEILLQCRNILSFINLLDAINHRLQMTFIHTINMFLFTCLFKQLKQIPCLKKTNRTELSVSYTRKDLCNIENLMDLSSFMNDNHLHSAFSETINLINIR